MFFVVFICCFFRSDFFFFFSPFIQFICEIVDLLNFRQKFHQLYLFIDKPIYQCMFNCFWVAWFLLDITLSVMLLVAHRISHSLDVFICMKNRCFALFLRAAMFFLCFFRSETLFSNIYLTFLHRHNLLLNEVSFIQRRCTCVSVDVYVFVWRSSCVYF